MSGSRRSILGQDFQVLRAPFARFAYGADNPTLSPAVAFGPVADTAEPVTPQAGIVGAEPDRDDGDTVPHG